ncbi:hypothetical protein [Pedobacter caeni]|uniref:Uncharacterized protein n=1 Tax=Pedobacter caeni TaxID=288992 RepID=A0A1M4ZF27_9SPHI|nr:hypothetical protein [Pedobacter caeni]SHF16568.1 hypothetical protein SAMN04488522_102302 [Pedobacter caeni]
MKIFGYRNKMKLIFTSLFFLFMSIHVFGQADDGLLSRLQGLYNQKIEFYNVDGFEISSQKFDVEFSKKNIVKNFKKSGIREADLNKTDSLLKFDNLYVGRSEEKVKGIVFNHHYYFIESPDKKLVGISFSTMNKDDKAFERSFVTLIKNNAIPNSVFNSMNPDSLNFAGRKIALGEGCRYMGVNNVQCPSNGQMSWSIHKTLEDASQTVNDQWKLIREQKGGKSLSDTTVNVVFEGREAIAKKMVYGLKGINSLLIKMDGAKTLTVYAVASPVKNGFISCIMSFWDSDNVNRNGLPRLLEKVMTLK